MSVLVAVSHTVTYLGGKVYLLVLCGSLSVGSIHHGSCVFFTFLAYLRQPVVEPKTRMDYESKFALGLHMASK